MRPQRAPTPDPGATVPDGHGNDGDGDFTPGDGPAEWQWPADGAADFTSAPQDDPTMTTAGARDYAAEGAQDFTSAPQDDPPTTAANGAADGETTLRSATPEGPPDADADGATGGASNFASAGPSNRTNTLPTHNSRQRWILSEWGEHELVERQVVFWRLF